MQANSVLTYGRARHCRFVRLAWVPMRDGTRLATTILLPELPGRYPVVLQRTPYNRLGCLAGWEEWVRSGYVLICQDVRGRYDSDGEFTPFLQEACDTPDTVGWIRQQEWCNGKVGMMGPSYLALAQTFGVASNAGPKPDALMPTFMGAAPWSRGFYIGGPLSLFLSFWWLCFDVGSRTNNSSVLEIYDVEELCRRLPLETLDVSCGAGVSRIWRELMAHPTCDDYWKQFSIRGRHDQFTMPTLQVGGWYDYYPAAMLANWNRMRADAATPGIAAQHKILLGPWGHHHGLEPTADGQRAVDFGPDSGYNYGRIYRAWFDRVFKGQPASDGLGERPIRLFVMGLNQWRDEDEWPLARTRFVEYYLHSCGHANTHHGDGGLSLTPPAAEPSDGYAYDPANPVPTRGGNHSVGPWNAAYKELIWCGPCDQRPVEERHDVLVYSGAPLEQDLEITGPVVLRLWAASSARDTDFVARLVDVYPDGKAINITEGVVRARFRDGAEAPPRLLDPGTIVEYSVDLQCTSNLFLRGHQLRLDITSSNFPLWDRNLNTGDDPNRSSAMQIARQEIHHTAVHASRLILPVIPNAAALSG
ncbi:MAG: CocE/NonD family hydrolase [bacterium]